MATAYAPKPKKNKKIVDKLNKLLAQETQEQSNKASNDEACKNGYCELKWHPVKPEQQQETK